MVRKIYAKKLVKMLVEFFWDIGTLRGNSEIKIFN